MDNASTTPNRFSPELWVLIRKLWEQTDGLSFEKAAKQAAQQLGQNAPTKATVSQRANREGWQRLGQGAEVPAAREPLPVKAPIQKAPAKSNDSPPAEKRHPNGRKANRTEKPETDSTVTQTDADVLAVADALLAKLTDKQRLFALEYLHDMNATAAYMRAFKTSNAKTAANEGYRLMRNPDVGAFLEAKINERAVRTEADADLVVKLWRDAALADPNEICEFRRVCCRYCYGVNFKYQFTPAEMEKARQDHLERRARALAETDGKYDMGEFDEQGGLGFNGTLDPNPECPECFGEGKGEAHFHDTRKLSVAARALYGGVKVGRDGLEVKVHSNQYAVDSLARHNQMFVEKLEVDVGTFDKGELEGRFGHTMSEARKRMAEIRKERGLEE